MSWVLIVGGLLFLFMGSYAWRNFDPAPRSRWTCTRCGSRGFYIETQLEDREFYCSDPECSSREGYQ